MSFASSFASIFAPIGRSLGFGQDNDAQDVLTTRRKFGMVGFDEREDDEAEDQIGGGLDRSVRRFQKQNGLTEDGIMNPGGETETALHNSLSEQIASITRRKEQDENASFRTPGINPLVEEEDPPQSKSNRPTPMRDVVKTLPVLHLKDRVGNNHTNDREDMTGIQEQLAGLGYLPQRHAHEPDLYITKPIEDAIRRFQSDNNLKNDGWAGPKGETEKAINRRVADVIGELKQKAKDQIRSITKNILPDASRNFQHYLNENGVPQILDGKIFRENNKFLQVAEKENTDRIINNFQDPNHIFYNQLSKMKVGESLAIKGSKGGLGDYIDRDFGALYDHREIMNKDARRNFDDLLAYGATKLRTVGQFKAKRLEDGFDIEGNFSHLWQDKYDFEGVYRPLANSWEKEGARPYKSMSAWENKVKFKIPHTDKTK